MQGRCRRTVARRPAADRLRCTERSRGHPRAARDGGRRVAAGARGRRAVQDRCRQAARHRQLRHAVLGQGTEAGRRPRRPAGAAGRYPGGHEPARRAEARRHAVHAQAHAQPGAQSVGVGYRTRGFRTHRRAVEAAGLHASQAHARRPGAGAHSGDRPVRPLGGPRGAWRRSEGEDAGVDRRSPGALRPALGVAAGRHLQLRDVRAGPSVAHLRPREDP